MNFIGVDACKKGWFAVALDRRGNWKIGIFKTIGDFWSSFQNASLILIDIPIGLPYRGKRECDTQTRKILRQRASSVFAVPCREALQVNTYRQACQINKRVTGVKLSIQTWNISAKIREIDKWLCHNKKAQTRVRESHPELCFWALAGGCSMTYSKKTAPGFEERLSILNKFYPKTGAIVDKALDQFLRKDLTIDDILDALVLAVSAGFSSKSIKTVPLNPPRDPKGLPMQIVFFVLNRADTMDMPKELMP
jgi:predicted RNase H-like nuclease